MSENGTESNGVCTRTFCNRCQQETNHSIAQCCSNHRNEGTEQAPRFLREKWQLLKCRGCDSVHVYMVEESSNSSLVRCQRYPPLEVRRTPPWCSTLPKELQGLIVEIYSALFGNCLALAAMGARTLIDKLLTDELGDVGGFQQKLKEAVSSNFLTVRNKDIITPAIEIGNAASHRGYIPTQRDVFDVLDIVEHCLEQSYILEGKSRRLSESVPARNTRQ